jgi:NAD(P)-dependent dehydrogenase (short-subunit alcohol dehydrogenase family)
MLNLEGKVAVVTGAGRGIGRGEARLLAEQGASVVVNDFGGSWEGVGSDSSLAQEVVDEILASGGRAIANSDDVASWDGAKRLINECIETWGRLDALVCNAGFVRDRMIFKMSEEEWDEVIRVHLKGHFLPTRFVTEYWRDLAKSTSQPAGGRIVYTGSEAGLFGHAGQPNYSAAKSGIASLGVTVAREMSRYGVTANTICPRGRTRMTETTFGDFVHEEGVFDAWDPDHVAPWVTFLCTDAAAHISGQTFVVAGGLVQVMNGWSAAGKIQKDARWTVDELRDSVAKLFGSRSTDIPPFPSMEGVPQRPS